MGRMQLAAGYLLEVVLVCALVRRVVQARGRQLVARDADHLLTATLL